MDLPRELSGWDTGTVCVTAPVKVEPVEGADFDWKEKKLVLSTLEAKQKIPSKAASTLSDRSIEWDVDEDIRLPTYDRYSSALYFDYGGAALTVGPLGKKVEAFAALCASLPSSPASGTQLMLFSFQGSRNSLTTSRRRSVCRSLSARRACA